MTKKKDVKSGITVPCWVLCALVLLSVIGLIFIAVAVSTVYEEFGETWRAQLNPCCSEGSICTDTRYDYDTDECVIGPHGFQERFPAPHPQKDVLALIEKTILNDENATHVIMLTDIIDIQTGRPMAEDITASFAFRPINKSFTLRPKLFYTNGTTYRACGEQE